MATSIVAIFRTGLEVIKLEFILKLKIKCYDWLLADTCPQGDSFWINQYTKNKSIFQIIMMFFFLFSFWQNGIIKIKCLLKISSFSQSADFVGL